MQTQVKRTKLRFDQLKVNTMQKVDLLVASHCNMYSHVLAKYQTAFLLTFERIARRLTAVADSIRACQYHAYTAVKVIHDARLRFFLQFSQQTLEILINSDILPTHLVIMRPLVYYHHSVGL